MPTIDHVIVLALENRSFDHMLGFLDHADPAYEGLRGTGLSNPVWPGNEAVEPTPEAKPVLPVDPDHSHDAVMQQLTLRGIGKRRHATNQGFVSSYERKARGLTAPRYEGLLGPLLNWLTLRFAKSKAPAAGRGPLIMLCQPPEQVPVLSTLAKEFALCTRWFCSVPGETWPNRNFMHAATSDWETDIQIRLYENPTIFERLEDGGKTWHIYHDGPPQAWVFVDLWTTPHRHANWFRFDSFAEHVRAGSLPSYSFIEPDHRTPLIGDPEGSNSQHPGNNLVPNEEYDTVAADGPDQGGGDFARGEALIANVYEALRANPEVFERSLLLITYDEHGGFYDHVPPPTGVPAPGTAPGRLARLLRLLWRRKAKAFDFTMLGPRVPAVVISPYVPRGTIDATVRDHAGIPATLHDIFIPDAAYLTDRDEWAEPFHTCLTLPGPRRADLPDLSAHTRRTARPAVATTGEPAEVPVHYRPFAEQAEEVQKQLEKVEEPEALALDRTQIPDLTTQAFGQAAARHRAEEGR